MNKEKLVINTLVFLDELRNGLPQSKLIDKISEMGIKSIEVRREFIKDFDIELANIKDKAQRNDIILFYSIPECLFKEDKLRERDLEKYFNEAFKMNCHYIKMNIGEVRILSKKDTDIINELCQKYSIKLTVENDQTELNGKCDRIYKFLSQNKKLGGEISFTFDVGNWLFQQEDPIKNAEILKDYVTYVHLKNVDINKRNVLLDEGIIEIEKILEILPKDLPMALEYPCASIDEIKEEINKALKF